MLVLFVVVDACCALLLLIVSCLLFVDCSGLVGNVCLLLFEICYFVKLRLLWLVVAVVVVCCFLSVPAFIVL